MVRTLSTRTQKAQGTIVFPGTTAAEPWELWTLGRDPRCLRTISTPSGADPAENTILALPMTQVIALPLWLQETRPEQFEDMINLQIESHGLQVRDGGAVFQWSIVAEEKTRTLVLVGVLAATLPEEIETVPFRFFDLSARCLPLPADALVFWLEQDRLNMAATRGGRLAYCQALSEPAFTTRVLQDIACIVASLRMQQIIGQLHEAVVWSDRPVPGAEKAGTALGLALRVESRPDPQSPDARWGLTPPRVGAATGQRRARRQQGRFIGLLCFLIIAALVALGGRYFLVSQEVDQLRQWQKSHAGDLAMVHQTAAAWKDLRPALDTRTYPLEILLNVSRALPNQQVHLTLFDLEGNHLLIRAEAANLTAAFEFLNRLKKSAALQGYTWEMAQPHLLGNDIAQLQVEGTYEDTH